MAQPQPEQILKFPRDVAEIFLPLLEPCRYKVAEGGRGGGKSHFFAEEAVVQCHFLGKQVLCCRETQTSMKESVMKLIKIKIHQLGLTKHFIILKTEIIHRTSSGIFTFAGLRQQGSGRSDAENLKSYEDYDICWVEEAQTISKQSLKLLLPTIRKPGSEIWFSYNRKDDNEPVHDRFVTSKQQKDNVIHIYVNYWDNPWLPEELQDEMEFDKANSLDDYNHIWKGLPRRFSGEHLITNYRVVKFEPNEHTQFKFAADWGFAPDPCTILRGWKDDEIRRIYIDYAIYKVGLAAEDIDKNLWSLVPDIRSHKITCDNARPEMIEKQKRQGYNAVACEKFPGSIEAGLTFLNGYEIWIHPRCEKQAKALFGEDSKFGLVTEAKKYKRKVDPKTGLPTSKIIDDYNHGWDAARYLFSDEIKAGQGIDYRKMMGKSKKGGFEKQKKIGEKQKRDKQVSKQALKSKLVNGSGVVNINLNRANIKIPGINKGIIL